MVVLLFCLVGLYMWVILRRLGAWQQMPVSTLPNQYVPQTNISVIIPVRNESQNIGKLLTNLVQQTYPAHLLEILVIDDHSEDETATVVNDFITQAPFPLKYIALAEHSNQTGKKAAVTAGIQLAQGELLAFTDGDCRVQPNWLSYLEYCCQTQKAKFISGPVCFEDAPGLFPKMQLVEFAGLIGMGASSIGLKQPNMCNGANIAYPKSIFMEVNGFAGNEHIASGDDEFLLHKVHRKYPEGVLFLKAPQAIVFTSPQTSLKAFLRQRVRWAGKWPAYTNSWVKLLAILVFGVNFMLLVTAIMAVLGKFPAGYFLMAIGLKTLADMLFMREVLRFFQKPGYLRYLIPLQFVYVPYVVVTALLALRGSYAWKGRKIKNKTF